MVRFPEAEARLFRNRYVCRRCKRVIRAPSRKIFEEKVTCRYCKSHAFKPKRKK